jgi:hypothetical protein
VLFLQIFIAIPDDELAALDFRLCIHLSIIQRLLIGLHVVQYIGNNNGVVFFKFKA